jgi:transcriptional regulator with XRE-family HTH domain
MELRRRRKAAGLTLQKLAEISGVSIGNLYALESQVVKLGNLNFKKAIACALGVDGPEFFTLWPEEWDRLRAAQGFTSPADPDAKKREGK